MSVYLTSQEKVREALNLSGSLSSDAAARINSAITHVTAILEKELDRHVEQTARTERFDVPYEWLRSPARDGWVVALRGYPVTAIASVKWDATRAFSGNETTMDSSLYYVPLDDDEEFQLTLDDLVATGRGVLQVTYTGGMAADTAALMTAFPDLAEAATLEVANLWQRRDSLSVTSFQSGADVTHYGELAMLPMTQQVIARRQRLASAG